MTRRAVVVGAGIAGLAAALQLHRIGWEPVVIERAPARRSSGYVVAFFGRGYDAAERMGILPALCERHVGAARPQ
ncbi:FAD-binding protein [Nonomuraea sp. K274]|uniref:FAD-binding protein n=1 Tax=Nonomuraea cypriaca TaxID=1187855 RepID=A0A931A9Z0_9ACTN|nr:FAD-binding protein [Nonomuraea cypriaca]